MSTDPANRKPKVSSSTTQISPSFEQGFVMGPTPIDELGPITTRSFDLGSHQFQIMHPAQPERLLALDAVAQAHDRDGYMPYWATVWPAARYLATYILQDPSLRAGTAALELGCGLGLPGLAALARGLRVTFSDYDETALGFAAKNAKLNGFEAASTMAMDWRAPLSCSFPVILGSDLIYEAAFAPRVARAFKSLLTPGGIGLLADQDRPYAADFRSALVSLGLEWSTRDFSVEEVGGHKVPGVLYRIFKPR